MTKPPTIATRHDPETIERLDRAFLRMRRMMVKPPTTTLPVAATGRPVDLAKVMACLAIADASDAETDGQSLDPGQAPTVKDLAATLELDHSTASRLLSEAEAEGLVHRGTDPADRRRTTVELTEVGRSVVAESAAMRNWVIGHVVAEWDAGDIDALANLLEKMNASLANRLPEVMSEAHAKFGCSLTRDA